MALMLPNPVIPAIPAISNKDWPIQDRPPPPVPEWTKLFDLNSNKNLQLDVRAAGTVASECTVADPTCAFTCSGCLRPTDITTVPAGHWGLTYDDGPTEFTVEILDKLKANNIKATFFVVASRVLSYPEIMRRAYEEGHQIAIHTWSHTMLTWQTNEEIIAEVMWSALAIYETIGVIPTYFRPPYGDIDDRVRALIELMGMKMIMWKYDSQDFDLATVPPSITTDTVESKFADFVAKQNTTSPGPITLEHDLWQAEADEGLVLMDMILKSGLAPGKVSELLGDAANQYQTPQDRMNAMADGLNSVQLNLNNSILTMQPPSMSNTRTAAPTPSVVYTVVNGTTVAVKPRPVVTVTLTLHNKNEAPRGRVSVGKVFGFVLAASVLASMLF